MPKRGSDRTKAKPSSKKKPSDAIQLLQEDHRRVETLFDQFLDADGGKRQQVAQQIFHELEVHSTLEEELFYPALQSQGDSADSALLEDSEDLDEGEDSTDTSDSSEMDATEVDLEEDADTPDEATDDMIATAYDEHRAVRDMIAQLKQKDASSPDFRQGMIELQQAVADHVSAEEDEMFAQAQLSVDIKMLGAQMQQRKQELLSEAA
ncbi:MAG: hypothetical protein A4E19_14380 [Nitrospira sp. SG-bin1]|nr:MAG: hypothetical protein A4E19_14380 [Nitrospira sp. SG-bin1]